MASTTNYTSTSTALTNATQTPATTTSGTAFQPSATIIAIIVGILIGGICILCSCWHRRRRQRVLPTLSQAPRSMVGRSGASYESARRLEESSVEFRNRFLDVPMSHIDRSSSDLAQQKVDNSKVDISVGNK